MKQEYLSDGSMFGPRKYTIDADKTFTTQIGECTRYQELRSNISVWYVTLTRQLTFDEKLGYASGMWSKQDSKLGMMIPDFSKKPSQVSMTVYVNKESTSAEKRFTLYMDVPIVFHTCTYTKEDSGLLSDIRPDRYMIEGGEFVLKSSQNSETKSLDTVVI